MFPVIVIDQRESDWRKETRNVLLGEEPKWDSLPMLYFPRMQPGSGQRQSQ